MAELLFGTGGVPLSAPPPRSTAAGIERVAELGLGCMELEFVRGVKMGAETAGAVGKLARQQGVRLSAHAPYYINLNSAEADKRAASREMLLQAARIAHVCGARNVVFHAGSYGDSPEREAYSTVKEQLVGLTRKLKDEGVEVCLRPEVTGKAAQFGTLDELVQLSLEIPGVSPCIDFAHWHARSGLANSYEEFVTVLETLKASLGRQALNDMHIHISGIRYGKRGEIQHLDLDDSDFRYQELLRALIRYQVAGLMICESPHLEGDALLLQRAYSARRV